MTKGRPETKGGFGVGRRIWARACGARTARTARPARTAARRRSKIDMAALPTIRMTLSFDTDRTRPRFRRGGLSLHRTILRGRRRFRQAQAPPRRAFFGLLVPADTRDSLAPQ